MTLSREAELAAHAHYYLAWMYPFDDGKAVDEPHKKQISICDQR